MASNDDPVPLGELLAPSQRPPKDGFFFNPTSRIYWADWRHAYDYVYVLDRLDHSNPATDALEPLYTGGRFQLFRVVR